MILREAVREFTRGYFSGNGHAEKTRRSYTTDINQFSEMVGHQLPISEIGRTQIEDWLDRLRTRGYASATIRRKIIVLKVFFGYWTRLDELNESPFWRMRIRYARSIQLPRTIQETEIRRLLTFGKTIAQTRSVNSVGPYEITWLLPLRNRTILELLFATGLRVGELSRLDIADFKSADASFRIQGKGGRERMAFVVDRNAIEALDRYLVVRRALSTETDALLINKQGTRLTTQGIANVITEMCVRIGIDRRITPHMFRHTVATLLLRNGTDLRLVQEFLGHASISTTQIYTHVSKEHLVRELKANHPSFDMRIKGQNSA